MYIHFILYFLRTIKDGLHGTISEIKMQYITIAGTVVLSCQYEKLPTLRPPPPLTFCLHIYFQYIFVITFIISTLFPHLNLFVSIFIQSYVNSNLQCFDPVIIFSLVYMYILFCIFYERLKTVFMVPPVK
jgi:hypothetical protein